MPKSTKQKAIRLQKRRDRQYSPAPSTTSTLVEDQVDVLVSDQIEEVQPQVSGENPHWPIQDNTANINPNILSNTSEFVNSEQVRNTIPSGYQNGSSSLLITLAGSISDESLEMSSINTAGPNAFTTFSNKKHNFEKQNDNSIICIRCGMSRETAEPECEGYRRPNDPISIDQIRDIVIEVVEVILERRFKEFSNEFVRKISMQNEMAARTVTQTYRNHNFHRRVAEYYRYNNCFVTGYTHNQMQIEAAHIFPLKQFVHFEACDTDRIGSINDPRNGLLLCTPIHHDFDKHRVTIRVKNSQGFTKFIFEANMNDPSVSSVSRSWNNTIVYFSSEEQPSVSLLQRHTEMYDINRNTTLLYS